MTNALTPEQIAGAVQALETEDAVGALLDATTGVLTQNKTDRFQLRRPRGGGRLERQQDLRTTPDSWITRWKGGIAIGYGSDAKAGRAGEGQLEFWVGVWFNRKQSRLLNERNSFIEQVKAQGLAMDIDDDGCFIGVGAPANTFLTVEATEMMDAQAQRIAEWMRPHLGRLLALKPGPYKG